MSILDKIKGKKDEAPKAQKDENVLDMVKEPTAEKDKAVVPVKDDTGSAYRILKSAHLSEKAVVYAQNGRYVFKVSDRANKIEVKKAVEKTYDVHVVSVNMINSKGKRRRTGRTFGRTSDWKKAIVTLKTGERIQGLIEGV